MEADQRDLAITLRDRLDQGCKGAEQPEGNHAGDDIKDQMCPAGSPGCGRATQGCQHRGAGGADVHAYDHRRRLGEVDRAHAERHQCRRHAGTGRLRDRSDGRPDQNEFDPAKERVAWEVIRRNRALEGGHARLHGVDADKQQAESDQRHAEQPDTSSAEHS